MARPSGNKSPRISGKKISLKSLMPNKIRLGIIILFVVVIIVLSITLPLIFVKGEKEKKKQKKQKPKEEKTTTSPPLFPNNNSTGKFSMVAAAAASSNIKFDTEKEINGVKLVSVKKNGPGWTFNLSYQNEIYTKTNLVNDADTIYNTAKNCIFNFFDFYWFDSKLPDGFVVVKACPGQDFTVFLDKPEVIVDTETEVNGVKLVSAERKMVPGIIGPPWKIVVSYQDQLYSISNFQIVDNPMFYENCGTFAPLPLYLINKNLPKGFVVFRVCPLYKFNVGLSLLI